ncbi:hypothetical protein TRVA0_034S00606 [Trichomonascus vanleenenianus]|uniref:uncharacterized protein n=1 Tax=Trichomonascus vanleenenianus TaxID=2268995 RepID=UPI003EC9B5EA
MQILSAHFCSNHSMMAFYTTRECFDKQLPSGPPQMAFTVKKYPYHRTHSSGKSTKTYKSVPVYWEELVGVYEKDCAAEYLKQLDQFFPRPDLHEQNEVNVMDPLHTQTPFLHYEWLKTEGDVTKLFVTEFIYPTKIALEKLLPKGKHIFCKAQKYHRETSSYFDFVWEIVEGNPKNPKNIIPLAIVELKMPGTINESDSNSGCGCTPDEYRFLRGGASSSSKKTRLKHNAVLLSKQAKKYSRYCKDIIFFDWNAMFIFNFNENTSRKAVVRGTYFKEDKRTRSVKNFRRIQLGVLVRRLQPHIHTGDESSLPESHKKVSLPGSRKRKRSNDDEAKKVKSVGTAGSSRR